MKYNSCKLIPIQLYIIKFNFFIVSGRMSSRQLSPLSKDKNSIGKLVSTKPENPETPIQPSSLLSRTIGVNTSKSFKAPEGHDSIQPVTHSKVNELPLRFNDQCPQLSRTSNKEQKSNISRKSNSKFKKSPIGSIRKQFLIEHNLPLSPKAFQIKNSIRNGFKTNYQLPSIRKIEKNMEKFKSFVGQNNRVEQKPYSQKPKQKKTQKKLKKTYTSSLLDRKEDPQEEQTLQHPKRLSKLATSRVKIPQFFYQSNQSDKKPTKQQEQQTNNPNLSVYSPQKDETEGLSQSGNRSAFYGFIYHRNSHSPNIIQIDLRTPITRIKQLLVEGQAEMHVSFVVPEIFFVPPSPQTTSQQLSKMMISAFSNVGMTPQIVSIKKYVNCVILREKRLCILWNFNGKVYFGGWDRKNMLTEGNKHGVGLEWVPARYIYYGQFRDNKKCGYGVMKNANKEVYVGGWKNNQKEGWGKAYDSRGRLSHKGQFSGGQYNAGYN